MNKKERNVKDFLSNLAKDIVKGNLSGYSNNFKNALKAEVEKVRKDNDKENNLAINQEYYAEEEREKYQNRISDADRIKLPSQKTNLKFSKTFKKLAENAAINHPPYYGGDNTYEVIKVLEAWDLCFHKSNALKYIYRSGKKSKETEIKDLEKAVWYIQRKIDLIRRDEK